MLASLLRRARDHFRGPPPRRVRWYCRRCLRLIVMEVRAESGTDIALTCGGCGIQAVQMPPPVSGSPCEG